MMIGVIWPPETTPIEFIPIIMAIPKLKATVTTEGLKYGELSTSPKQPTKRRIIDATNSDRNKVANNKYLLLTIFASDLKNSRNQTDLFDEPRWADCNLSIADLIKNNFPINLNDPSAFFFVIFTIIFLSLTKAYKNRARELATLPVQIHQL